MVARSFHEISSRRTLVWCLWLYWVAKWEVLRVPLALAPGCSGTEGRTEGRAGTPGTMLRPLPPRCIRPWLCDRRMPGCTGGKGR